MASYLKNEVVLVRYPFSDLSNTKVRPAIVVNDPHESQDFFIVPLSSRSANLLRGEFILNDWEEAGLNVSSSVKRGIYTVLDTLIIKKIGTLSERDAQQLDRSIREWLGVV